MAIANRAKTTRKSLAKQPRKGDDMTIDEAIKGAEEALLVIHRKLVLAKGKARTALRSEAQKLEIYLDGLYFKRNMAR